MPESKSPTTGQVAAVIYADLFNFPLTPEELYFWEIKTDKGKNYRGRSGIRFQEGFWYVLGREKIVRRRKKMAGYSRRCLERIRTIPAHLSRIPTVEGIFLTGSLAIENGGKNADADLMIITKPGTMWLTRLLVVTWLKISGNYRTVQNQVGTICPNIFLDTDHLKITEQNLFTAHEVLQARCLYDRRGVEQRWLAENKWTKNYLPNAYKLRIGNWKLIGNWQLEIGNFWLIPFETIAFWLQYFYMKPKMTNEKVGWGAAFFHPQNLSREVMEQFHKRLAV